MVVLGTLDRRLRRVGSGSVMHRDLDEHAIVKVSIKVANSFDPTLEMVRVLQNIDN